MERTTKSSWKCRKNTITKEEKENVMSEEEARKKVEEIKKIWIRR